MNDTKLPLPEVVVIKPVNQFADKLFALVTAPAKEKIWHAPQQLKTDWSHIEYEKGETK